MIQLAIAVFIVIIGSAICSGIETALLSVPLLRVKQLAQSKPSPGAIALLSIRQHVSRPIATIVILNNIFNIVGSIVVGRIAAQLFDNTGLGIFSAFLTFAIILFAEILPKTLGERYAEKIGIAVAIPVQGATVVCTPLIWLLEKITAPLTKGSRRPVTNESEIRLLTILGCPESRTARGARHRAEQCTDQNAHASSSLRSRYRTYGQSDQNLSVATRALNGRSG